MTHMGSIPFGWVSPPLSLCLILSFPAWSLEQAPSLSLLKGNRFSVCQGGVTIKLFFFFFLNVIIFMIICESLQTVQSGEIKHFSLVCSAVKKSQF